MCDSYNKKISIEKEQSIDINNELIDNHTNNNDNSLETKKRKLENDINPDYHSSLSNNSYTLTSSNSVELLPYPKIITLTSKHRIQIPIVLNNDSVTNTSTTTASSNTTTNIKNCSISLKQHNSSSNNNEFIELNNNLLKCKLSKSLIYAIVRDRETQMLHYNSTQGTKNKINSKNNGINNSILKLNTNSPSVKELLYTIQCQCIDSIPNFNNDINIINQFLNLFEYCFEDYLLYPG